MYRRGRRYSERVVDSEDARADGLLRTPDGSVTAYSARFGEHYSSRHGARTQARHVFVEGSRTHLQGAPRVLEVGFGLGINFRATLADARTRGVPLTYVAFEFDPAPRSVLEAAAEDTNDDVWAAVLASWGAPLTVDHPGVHLDVRVDDVTAALLPAGWATAIYLDGFSPARNPEVWTPAFTERLAGALAPGGVLTTYSAAGDVRRALLAAGLQVTKRAGPPGKREHLVAERPA
ncbi:protein of unknown function DUF752 [Deinococcus maricopensis DSM 21211]|uniref:MnmC-like methyltransferase domain-containing protein n=1 Tax=Deinococcus maricopensis (strain DSM 21211 / LMG 22137 / NRRL B-23946 / LB-34) TaxID=709986 RepID=E8U807_DEIML|nr:protein of unknown function DUF752 [Deinococcus maricopensis DSM 21211]